jgi:hypothetical protein
LSRCLGERICLLSSLFIAMTDVYATVNDSHSSFLRNSANFVIFGFALGVSTSRTPRRLRCCPEMERGAVECLFGNASGKCFPVRTLRHVRFRCIYVIEDNAAAPYYCCHLAALRCAAQLQAYVCEVKSWPNVDSSWDGVGAGCARVPSVYGNCVIQSLRALASPLGYDRAAILRV